MADSSDSEEDENDEGSLSGDPVDEASTTGTSRDSQGTDAEYDGTPFYKEKQQLWKLVEAGAMCPNRTRRSSAYLEFNTKGAIEAQLVMKAQGYELMPHQREAVGQMIQLEESQSKGLILADDMGLGKTLEIIWLIALRPRPQPTLIVVPARLRVHWKREITNYMPTLSVKLY